jgi:hypothetical protein
MKGADRSRHSSRRAFRVPHIGNDTVPGSAMKPSGNGKAFDLVLHARLKCHGLEKHYTFVS